MDRLVLASASPRRRQLIAWLGLPYTVATSPIDEKKLVLSGTPSRQAMDCARAKAEATAMLMPDDWILAADTIVCIDDGILGKPRDRADARRMLTMLSGRVHTVTTGVCLFHAGRRGPETVSEETRVWMAPVSEARIEAYIDTGEPMDKAGAYGIQGYGGALIPRIEGCYFNVMGLPLYRTMKLLEEAGLDCGAAAAFREGGGHG